MFYIHIPIVILQNSVQEIERLTKFLGLQTSVNLSKDVARKCSFENMKGDKKRLESDVWRSAWRKNEPRFYRKGSISKIGQPVG